MVEIQADSTAASGIQHLQLAQPHPYPALQLVGGPLGERDHQQVVERRALLQPADNPLDQHGRLAGSGPGRDEHAAAALDRVGLPAVPGAGCDHFATRQMPPAWRRHHSGQLPEIGSCRTAPERIRATMSLA